MADLLSDIDTALAAPPPPSDAQASAPASPLMSDIDNALAGKAPTAVAPPAHTLNRSLANIGAGADTGVIAGTLGAPVDLATAALNVVPHALGYEGIQHP